MVVQTDGAGLDGDAALALELHVVEQTVFHFTLINRVAVFQQTVGKRGLTVVNVGNDGEISNIFLFCHVFINIGMSIGLAPITGLPLPFVSYGGSFLFIGLCSMGILQSIYRYRLDFEE